LPSVELNAEITQLLPESEIAVFGIGVSALSFKTLSVTRYYPGLPAGFAAQAQFAAAVKALSCPGIFLTWPIIT
jgi:hypothetical protein